MSCFEKHVYFFYILGENNWERCQWYLFSFVCCGIETGLKNKGKRHHFVKFQKTGFKDKVC